MGDRVGLFAFDARPRLASGLASGPAAFPLLQRLAALDRLFRPRRPTSPWASPTLAGRLDRRALVVVFTDFADATSAELMIENVGAAAAHATWCCSWCSATRSWRRWSPAPSPGPPEDVSRAVIADAPAAQREAGDGAAAPAGRPDRRRAGRPVWARRCSTAISTSSGGTSCESAWPSCT